jgi:hypothetical protein
MPRVSTVDDGDREEPVAESLPPVPAGDDPVRLTPPRGRSMPLPA